MASTATVVDLNSKKISCDRCGVKQRCLGPELDASESGLFGDIKGPYRLLRRGDHLFHAGDPFHSLYVIRSGAVKTYLISEDGEEQIIGFYGPGEMIGFDAIDSSQYQCSAAALDTASICRLSFEALSELCVRSPKVLRELIKGMSRETLRLAGVMLLGRKNADQRIASFLLIQSTQQNQRGYSATALTLSMSRTDMARYLGLTLETVSRELARLQALGLLTKDRAQIHVHDLDALRRIAAEPMGSILTESLHRAVAV